MRCDAAEWAGLSMKKYKQNKQNKKNCFLLPEWGDQSRCLRLFVVDDGTNDLCGPQLVSKRCCSRLGAFLHKVATDKHHERRVQRMLMFSSQGHTVWSVLCLELQVHPLCTQDKVLFKVVAHIPEDFFFLLQDFYSCLGNSGAQRGRVNIPVKFCCSLIIYMCMLHVLLIYICL